MTPDLMEQGAKLRQDHEAAAAAALQQGGSGGRTASFGRLLTEGLPDFGTGVALYLDDITVSFIVKEAMTDDSPETEVRLAFTGRETVEQVRDLVRAAVAGKRASVRGKDDDLTQLLASWPRPVLTSIARSLSNSASWAPRARASSTQRFARGMSLRSKWCSAAWV